MSVEAERGVPRPRRAGLTNRGELMFVLVALAVAPLGSGLQHTQLVRPFPYFYQMLADAAIVLVSFGLCLKSLRRAEPAWLGIACLSAIVGTTHLLRIVCGGLLC